jgi:transcriptional regulator with XRE-family HTH domain
MLGEFLRERRGRVSLESAGLPARRGRRGAGTVTQEDLARLTGYSIRTISALEQGAEHRPTPELLEAIASALRLTTDERSILWYLATGAPPPEAEDDPPPDPALDRLVRALEPHPAYLTDAFWRVHSHNAAFAAWICDFSAVPAGERTILHWFFLDPHSRHVLPDWPGETAMIIARARARAMRSRRGHELTAIIESICARSPEADRRWRAGGELLLDGPSREAFMRPPGHTDPAGPDDRHVRLTLTTLTPLRTGDERRLLAFLLPDGTPPALGARPCPACARTGAVS